MFSSYCIKSQLETHLRKHIRRNTFEFLISSAKNQTTELRKSYSPKRTSQNVKFETKNPAKLP